MYVIYYLYIGFISIHYRPVLFHVQTSSRKTCSCINDNNDTDDNINNDRGFLYALMSVKLYTSCASHKNPSSSTAAILAL